jgi:hypothetical protein
MLQSHERMAAQPSLKKMPLGEKSPAVGFSVPPAATKFTLAVNTIAIDVVYHRLSVAAFQEGKP